MRKLQLALLLLVAFAILVTPFSARLLDGRSLIFGEEPYYHARIASAILQGTLSAADTLIYNSRPFYFGPYHIILVVFARFFSIEWASAILPVLFGVASFGFFSLILDKFEVELKKKLLMCLVLVISPGFISTFSQSNPHSLAILLYLSGFYLLLDGKSGSQKASFKSLFGFALLSLTIIFGLFNFILLLIILLGAYTVDKKRLMLYISVLFFALAVAAFYYLFIFTPEIPTRLFSQMISDLGGTGFGMFSFLLVIVGIRSSWHARFNFIIPYMLILSLFAAYFFSAPSIPYLAFAMAIFAGEGLYRIISLQWELQLIRYLVILIIVCGLVFSTVSFMGRLYNSGPDKDTVRSLEFLSHRDKGVVFSHYSNGFWIEYFAKQPVLLDGFLVSELKRRYQDSEEAFHSRDLAETKGILDKYSVKYIYIDRSMTHGKVWGRADEGMLFLLRNNESFTRIYTSNDTQIWQYKS